MDNWKDKIDLGLKDHLERQIKETHNNKEAILSSNDPKVTQLWIAVANLSREIFEINLRLKYLERAMRDMSKIQRSEVMETRKPENNVKEVLERVLAGNKAKRKVTKKKTTKKKITKKKPKKTKKK